MEKARYNTELYSNLRVPLNNVKPSNFWGSHQIPVSPFILIYESDYLMTDITSGFFTAL